MYLWNVKALAADFREERVSQHEQYKYALTLAILLSAGFSLCAYISTAQSWVASFSRALVDLVATVVGTVACYRANQSGDDKDFLVRYCCLGLPVGISTATVGGLCLFPLAVLLVLTGSPISAEMGGWLGGVVINVATYWRLWHWTRFIAHSGSATGGGGNEAPSMQQTGGQQQA